MFFLKVVIFFFVYWIIDVGIFLVIVFVFLDVLVILLIFGFCCFVVLDSVSGFLNLFRKLKLGLKLGKFLILFWKNVMFDFGFVDNDNGFENILKLYFYVLICVVEVKGISFFYGWCNIV